MLTGPMRFSLIGRKTYSPVRIPRKCLSLMGGGGNMRRRQRAAISQAEIIKKCKLYKEVLEGFRAFRAGHSDDNNPYDPVDEMKQYQAWRNGWLMAQEKENE